MPRILGFINKFHIISSLLLVVTNQVFSVGNQIILPNNENILIYADNYYGLSSAIPSEQSPPIGAFGSNDYILVTERTASTVVGGIDVGANPGILNISKNINTTGNSVVSVMHNTIGSYNIINGPYGSQNISRNDSGSVLDLRNANLRGIVSVVNNGTMTAQPGSNAIDFSGATARIYLYHPASRYRNNTINGNIYGSGGIDTITPVGDLSYRDIYDITPGTVINGNIIGGSGPDYYHFYGMTSFSVSSGDMNFHYTKDSKLNGNIVGSNKGDRFDIGGGHIVGTISGGTGANVLNINGDFTTEGGIDRIQTINVNNDSNFLINNPITNLDTVLTINQEATSTVGVGGVITGRGNISNNGAMIISGGDISSVTSNVNSTLFSLTNLSTGTVTISGNGTIGKNNVLGNFINNGMFNIGGIGESSNEVEVNILNLTNDSGEIPNVISLGRVTILDTLTNTRGIISLNGGDLSVKNLVNNSISTAANTTFDISAGSMTVSGVINNNLRGILISGGDLSGYSSAAPGSLTNAATITVSGTGTIGNINRLGDVINNGTFTANGGNIKIGAFLNDSAAASPTLNITNGSMMPFGSITNANGNIEISGNGDLSSGDLLLPSGLINKANKTVTVSGTGTIGSTNRLGDVINNGTFAANGGNIKVGAFLNDSTAASPTLNITNGSIMFFGAITNTNGNIAISGNGDLSSGDPVVGSDLINKANKSITVSGTGAIGNTNKLSNIINNGIFTASGGNIRVDSFLNDSASVNPTLNITSGSMKIYKSINNVLGGITISGSGDLSSGNATNLGDLINAAGQTVIVSGTGTIGNNERLGNITNYGIIELDSTVCKVNSLINSGLLTIKRNFNYSSDLINDINSIMDIKEGAVVTMIQGVNPVPVLKINNLGTIINNGTINATNILHSGELKNTGTINANINFGANTNNTLNILGGSINGVISGGEDNIVEFNLATKATEYSILNPINNIGGIIINKGTVNVERDVVGVNNRFSVGVDAVVNLKNKILGSGVVNNSGKIVLNNSTDSSLSTISGFSNFINNNANAVVEFSKCELNIPKVTNILGMVKVVQNSTGGKNITTLTNKDNVELSSAVSITNFTNHGDRAALNINAGMVKIKNLNNVLGTINVSGGDLSAFVEDNTNILTNQANQTINISSMGMIGNDNPFGVVNNNGIINAGSSCNVTVGDFTNNNLDASLNITNGIITTRSINNILGSIKISGGDLSSRNAGAPSSLSNGANQVITISNRGTIGASHSLGDINNNGIINAGGGNVTAGDFTNNNLNASLNITNGIIKTRNINNILGSIKIYGGDLSSANIGTLSSLSNAANQVITISNGGTIGVSTPLGDINNNGIINAGGGNVTVGDFTNNNLDASLNITNGIIRTKNINNILGSIKISGGDLSSVNVGTPSYLINAVNQIITISNGGTIGVNGALGSITNNGTFNIATTNTATFNTGNITNNGIFNISNSLEASVGGGFSTFTNNKTLTVMQPISFKNINYTIGAQGEHIVAINDNNVGVLSLVNGSITLNSGSTIKIEDFGNLAITDQEQLTIMSCEGAGSVIGNVSNIKAPVATSLLSYGIEKTIDNKKINLIVDRKSLTDAIKDEASIEELLIAKELDKLFADKVTGELKIALGTLTKLNSVKELINAVNQLSPETNAISETGFVGPSLVLNTVNERIDLIARSGINNLQTGYAAGSMQSSNGLWLKGIVGNIKQQKRMNFNGYIANSTGMAFGLDDQFIEDTWFGIGFSTVNTHINNKGTPAKKTKINAKQLTLYGSYSSEDYYIDLLAAMAFNKYSYIHHVQYGGINQTRNADYNALQPSAKITAGYIYGANDLKVIPNISLQYSTLRQNSYTETGAGALNLKVNSSTLQQLEVGAGIKFAILYHEENNQTYNPDLHVMMLKDLKNSAQVTSAQFVGGGGVFSVTGATPAKMTYNVGMGLTMIHRNRFNLTASYDLRKKSKFIGHAGSLAIRYEF